MKCGGDYDCVIVGGGVAGLSAAAYLSKAGLKTILFEKNDQLGGVAGSFYADGYIFDVGGTPQYDQLQLLKEFDVDTLVEYQPMGNPSIAMYFPDYTICGPMEIDEFIVQYHNLCNPQHLEELRRILIACSEIDISKYLRLNQAINESKIRFLWSLLGANPIELFKVFRLMTQDTETWLRKRTSDNHILNDLIFYNGLTMMYPTARTPALIFVLIMCGLVGGLAGRWHVVKGGNNKFFLALSKAIERQGGTVSTMCRVSKILINDGVARGVLLENGSEIRGKYVISDIGIRETVRYLAGEEYFEKSYIEKIESLKPSPSWFKIHQGVNKKPEFNAVVNFVVRDLNETKWWEAIDDGRLPEKPPFLFWCKYLVDPSRAPEGKYDIDILTAAPYCHQGGDWDMIKKGEREKIMSIMEEISPGISKYIEYEQVYTPKDFEKYSGHERAGILPVEPSVEQLMKVPDMSLPVKNLYCVGATVKGGAGVNGAAFTGKLCANKIIKKQPNSKHMG